MQQLVRNKEPQIRLLTSTKSTSHQLQQIGKNINADVAKLLQQLKDLQNGEETQTTSKEGLERQPIGASSSKQNKDNDDNYKIPDQPTVVNDDPRCHKKAKM